MLFGNAAGLGYPSAERTPWATVSEYALMRSGGGLGRLDNGPWLTISPVRAAETTGIPFGERPRGGLRGEL